MLRRLIYCRRPIIISLPSNGLACGWVIKRFRAWDFRFSGATSAYNVNCCCWWWCFLLKDRFFLIDAKFLCHVPFLSALRNQSHSLHPPCISASNNIVLGFPGVFFPRNLPSMTFCNRESCLKTCSIQFFCLFLKFSIKERLSSTIPNICSFDALDVSMESSSFVARSTSQRPLDFWYPLVSMSRFHYRMKPHSRPRF